MPPTSQPAIALSREEVLVVLAHLEARGLLGLPPTFLDSYSKNETRLVLEAAERALVARNLLTYRQERFVINDELRALVGICAFPHTSLAVIQQRGLNRPDTYHFHDLEGKTVLHAQPMEGIHQFISLRVPEGKEKAILSILALPDLPTPQEALQAGPLPRAVLVQAQQAVLKSGAEGGSAVLQAAGLPRPAAELLGQSMALQPVYTSLVLVDLRQPETAGRGLAVLSGAERLWLLTSEPADGETRSRVSLAGSTEVIAALRQFLQVQ